MEVHVVTATDRARRRLVIAVVAALMVGIVGSADANTEVKIGHPSSVATA